MVRKYLEIMKSRLSEAMAKATLLEKDWHKVSPSPLLSGTMDECMERELDASQYGTKYSTSGVMCAGIGTAVDSLSAIRKLVFADHAVSFADLGAILATDWKNQEQLRLLAARRAPKWGNGDDSADLLGQMIVEQADELIIHTPNAKGSHYQMGLWSIDWAYTFGRETAATPDGRHCGAPISRNTGSTVSCDNEGIAGLIASTAKLDYRYCGDGAVLDVMLSPRSVSGPSGSELIVRLIRTFFARGGLFIQFNVLSPEVLRDAQLHPLNYRNLQIRLCGWNVRFIDLPPKVQETFIAEAANQR